MWVSGVAAPHAPSHRDSGSDPLGGCTATDDLMQSNDTERLTASATYAKVKEIKTIGVVGTVRVRFSLAKNVAGNASARIYINDVAVGTVRSAANGAGWLVFNEDVSVVAGDLIQLYAMSYDGNDAKVQDFRLLGDMYVPPSYTNQDP